MNEEPIAETVVVVKRPDEAPMKVELKIGRPYRVEGEFEEWACPVSLKPLYPHIRDVHAGNSFQALGLAASYALNLLRHEVENDGSVETEEGGPFPFDAYLMRPSGDVRIPRSGA